MDPAVTGRSVIARWASVWMRGHEAQADRAADPLLVHNRPSLRDLDQTSRGQRARGIAHGGHEGPEVLAAKRAGGL